MTKLDRRREAAIVAAVRRGSYPYPAAQAAGVAKSTFHRWMHSDKPEYRALQRRIEAATFEAEANAVASIELAAASDWRAAAWLLERKYPDRWARVSQRAEPKQDPQDPKDADAKPTDPLAEMDELAEARRRRGAG